MTITDDDIRYWVNKVPRINSEVTNLLTLMKEEIPAFLSYLSQRKLLTEQLNRMWFHPLLLKTEALRKVIAASEPTVIKELKQRIKDMFLDFGVEEIFMTATDIKEEWFRGSRFENNYIEKVLRESMPATNKSFIYKGTRFDDEAEAILAVRLEMKMDNDFEAMKHITIESVNRRYTYPKMLPNPQNANELIRFEVKRQGRPYRFLRKHFVADNEQVQLDPETKHINDMTPGNGVVEDAQQDLPF